MPRIVDVADPDVDRQIAEAAAEVDAAAREIGEAVPQPPAAEAPERARGTVFQRAFPALGPDAPGAERCIRIFATHPLAVELAEHIARRLAETGADHDQIVGMRAMACEFRAAAIRDGRIKV